MRAVAAGRLGHICSLGTGFVQQGWGLRLGLGTVLAWFLVICLIFSARAWPASGVEKLTESIVSKDESASADAEAVVVRLGVWSSLPVSFAEL